MNENPLPKCSCNIKLTVEILLLHFCGFYKGVTVRSLKLTVFFSLLPKFFSFKMEGLTSLAKLNEFPFSETFGKDVVVFEPGVVFVKGAFNDEQQKWLVRYALVVSGVLTEIEVRASYTFFD